MRATYHPDGSIDIRLTARDLMAADTETLSGLQRALGRFAKSIGRDDEWNSDDWMTGTVEVWFDLDESVPHPRRVSETPPPTRSDGNKAEVRALPEQVVVQMEHALGDLKRASDAVERASEAVLQAWAEAA